jgi:hypothetical protein
MNNNSWTAFTSFDAVCRRAAGRNRYHALRRFRRAQRRCRVAHLLGKYGLGRYGVLSRIARDLGVNRSTISRDVTVLLAEARIGLYASDRLP